MLNNSSGILKGSKYKLFFFFLLSYPIFSQNFLGIIGSNYIGTNAIAFNPANAVDTREKFSLNLASVGFDFQNNYARWTAPYSFLSFITQSVPSEYKNSNGTLILWRSEYITPITQKKKVNMFANAELKGPAFHFDFKKIGLGIAAGVRYRFLTSISQNSPEVGLAIVEGTKSSNLIGKTFENQKIVLNSGYYNEFFGSLAKVILKDEERFLKIGITGKYLVSDMAVNILANNFAFNVITSPTDNKKQNINLPYTEATYALASIHNGLNATVFTDQMTKLSGIGKGFGGDLGLIYEFRPDVMSFSRNNNGKGFTDPTKNKYLYKIGFSIVDIGFIRFASDNFVRTNEIYSKNVQILPGDYNKINGYEELISSTEQAYNVTNPTFVRNFLMNTPASAITTFDYNFKPNLYLNIIWRQYLLQSSKIGPVGYSGISVIPRYEKKNYMISVPISLDNNYQNLNIGFSARYSSFFVGSDNLTGWLNLFNPRGLSVFAGAFIPLYHKLPESPLKCYDSGIYRKFKSKSWRKF